MSKAVAQATNWHESKQTKLEPCGHHLIVKPRNVDSISKGGIHLVDETQDLEKRANQIGTVIAVGRTCWREHARAADLEYEPWCKVGDTVMYSRYSGSDVPKDIQLQVDPTADRLVLINDEDVLSVIR